MPRQRRILHLASRSLFGGFVCACAGVTLGCVAASYDDATSQERGVPVGTVGDLDGDNQVTQADITRFQSLAASVDGFFGSQTGDSAFRPEADLDGNGKIDWVDLQMLINELNKQ